MRNFTLPVMQSDGHRLPSVYRVLHTLASKTSPETQTFALSLSTKKKPHSILPLKSKYKPLYVATLYFSAICKTTALVTVNLVVYNYKKTKSIVYQRSQVTVPFSCTNFYNFGWTHKCLLSIKQTYLLSLPFEFILKAKKNLFRNT